MRLGLSKILGKLVVKYVPTYILRVHLKEKGPAKALSNDTYAMLLLLLFFLIFLTKACVVGSHLNCIDKSKVDAIQMGIHNIFLSKEVGKKYTGCNLKTTLLLGCALIGVCAVIRSKTVPNKTKSAIFVYLMSFLLPTDSYFIPQQRNRANF